MICAVSTAELNHDLDTFAPTATRERIAAELEGSSITDTATVIETAFGSDSDQAIIEWFYNKLVGSSNAEACLHDFLQHAEQKYISHEVSVELANG